LREIQKLARRLRVQVGNADETLNHHVFHIGDTAKWAGAISPDLGSPQQCRRCIISRNPLPRPSITGWQFFLVADDCPHENDSNTAMPDRRIGSPVHGVPADARGWYASLDDHGELRLHPGRPEYVKVDSLAAMYADPGTVFSAPMTCFDPIDEQDDPFNGMQ
jgi:hypothetical protein